MSLDDLKKIALQIAGLLPSEREHVECVLAMVEDLVEWRGYSAGPASPSARATFSGSDEASPQ